MSLGVITMSQNLIVEAYRISKGKKNLVSSFSRKRNNDKKKAVFFIAKNKKPSKLTNGVILLYDNACSHIAQMDQEQVCICMYLVCMYRQVLEHPLSTVPTCPHATSTCLAY